MSIPNIKEIELLDQNLWPQNYFEKFYPNNEHYRWLHATEGASEISLREFKTENEIIKDAWSHFQKRNNPPGIWIAEDFESDPKTYSWGIINLNEEDWIIIQTKLNIVFNRLRELTWKYYWSRTKIEGPWPKRLYPMSQSTC